MSDRWTIKFQIADGAEMHELPDDTLDTETLKLIMISGRMHYHGRRLHPSAPVVDIGTRQITWTLEALEQ